jgi:hypothetical protein
MGAKQLKILLQTTTPFRPDDWSVDSLTLLRQELEALDLSGNAVSVTARNRESSHDEPDPVLAGIDDPTSTSSGCSLSTWMGASPQKSAPPSTGFAGAGEAFSR